MAREDGDVLPEPCPSPRHGHRMFTLEITHLPLEHDPSCGTCKIRATLADHDHLHLNLENMDCQTPGINGEPGEMVKCKCGSYHH